MPPINKKKAAFSYSKEIHYGVFKDGNTPHENIAQLNMDV